MLQIGACTLSFVVTVGIGLLIVTIVGKYRASYISRAFAMAVDVFNGGMYVGRLSPMDPESRQLRLLSSGSGGYVRHSDLNVEAGSWKRVGTFAVRRRRDHINDK